MLISGRAFVFAFLKQFCAFFLIYDALKSDLYYIIHDN